MRPGPTPTAEKIVGVFVPPASREEVLGDLHERYGSPLQYALDALRAVPLVVASRIRRTADPQVLLMQAFALYVSFLGAAWLMDGALLGAPWGLLRLSIPAVVAMLGLILEDAYAIPGRRGPLRLARGPVLGVGLAFASQGILWIGNPDLAVPHWIVVYGCAMSLLMATAVRMLFPPAADQLQGANAPAGSLKQAGGSPESSAGISRVVEFAAIAAIVIGGALIVDRAGMIPPLLVLVILLVANRVWKRKG